VNLRQQPGDLPINRLAGIVTLVGCSCAIAGSFLPWIEATDPASGTTFTRAGIEGHYAMLVDLLALIAAVIGGFVILRRIGGAGLSLTLTMLAMAQLGLVIFVASNLSLGVVQLQAAGATAGLGLGIYLTGLGAVIALAGGILVWRKLPLRSTSA
jgi:hypothetical protein